MKIAAIDFETANRNMTSICSVGVSVMEDGVIEENAFYSLIRPEKSVNYFDPFNITIHHITPDMVADAPEWPEVFEGLNKVIDGAVLCAHNANFDMTCIRRTSAAYGLSIPDYQYFDTVQLSKRAYPELAHHRLNDMCQYLSVPLNHHNASSDAYGCLMIVEKTMEMTNSFELDSLFKTFHMNLKKL